MTIKIHCPCDIFVENMQGGIGFGGEAEVVITDPGMNGGIAFGGNAVVDSSRILDDYQMFYPLIEQGDGTEGEYKDLTAFARHATAGNAPMQTDGLFCSFAQQFNSQQWIVTPADSLQANTNLTISLWARYDQFLEDMVFFSRNATITLGIGLHGFIQATIRDVIDGVGVDHMLWANNPAVFPSQPPEWDRWIHVALTWEHALHRLRVYVNGIMRGSRVIGQSVSLMPADRSYIGARTIQPDVQLFEGKVQEVRVAHVARSEKWLKAERDNFCVPSFYSVIGAEGSTTYG